MLLNVILVAIVLFIGLIIPGLLGYNFTWLLLHGFTWLTTYVLPWLFFYLFVRFYQLYRQRQ